MNKHTITTTHQVRYFSLNEFTENTKSVWFVLHGYGQLANYFIKKFECLNSEENFVIAPEGSHRFYTQGMSGRVGASWMTQEDRELDIANYINYLNLVYDEIMKKASGKNITLNVLGFSQGSNTVTRWVNARHVKADNLILWSGAFHRELDFKLNKKFLNKMGIYLLLGDKDPFADAEKTTAVKKILDSNGIKYRFIPFEGEHKIYEAVLKKFVSDIMVL